MADLIERDYLIKKFEDTGQPAISEMGKGYDLGIKAALRVVKKAPTVNRWIPCSERLSEENKVVLVSTTTGYVDFAVLRWGKWFPDGYNGVAFPPNRITAWMPKPDAYVPPEV